MRKNNDSEGRKARIFITVAVLALMAGVAVFTTSAAFTATTSNPGNQIEAGTRKRVAVTAPRASRRRLNRGSSRRLTAASPRALSASPANRKTGKIRSSDA